MAKHIVTSALPYVNNVPHLGNLIPAISADVYARFLEQQGHNVLSVLGTDEHGTTTEVIARKKGVTPQELVNIYHKKQKEIYDWFNCDFNAFGRTSSKTNHNITQQLFKDLHENGYVIEKTTTQLYDTEAKTFLSDRYVKGTCPHCGYTEANGDQCEECGKLLNPTELINPKSTLTDTKPIEKETTHFYLDLENLQPELEDFFKNRSENWSEKAKKVTQNWFKEGLKPRAITRDLDWGIKVPRKGYENKVFYVWFDAPLGYISISKDSNKDWADWWHDEDTTLTQFMGKDNIPFHTIMFPATLIGAQSEYHKPDIIDSNEYILFEDKQFSKSKGVGVFGDDAAQSGIPADAWRYYLMTNRPQKSDTTFTWNDFQQKINNELIGIYGNLIHRTLSFQKQQDINTQKKYELGTNWEEQIQNIKTSYKERNIKQAVHQTIHLAKKANAYFQENEPWKKETDKHKRQIVGTTLSIIRDITYFLQPITPSIAKNAFDQLNLKTVKPQHLHKPLQTQTNQPRPILEKLEDEKKQKLHRETTTPTPGIKLRVGKITSVEKHPNADKLYIENITFGDKDLQVISGLVKHYKKEELLNKKVVVVTNLETAKLRGQKSEGMILAVDKNDEVSLLTAPKHEVGAQIAHTNITPTDKISFKDFQELSLEFKQGFLYINNQPHIQGKKISSDKDFEGQVK